MASIVGAIPPIVNDLRTSDDESEALRPDLAKFRHSGTILKVLGKFLRVYLVFGKMLILLWQKCNDIGQVFMVVPR